MDVWVVIPTNLRIDHVGTAWGPFFSKEAAEDFIASADFPTPEEVLVRKIMNPELKSPKYRMPFKEEVTIDPGDKIEERGVTHTWALNSKALTRLETVQFFGKQYVVGDIVERRPGRYSIRLDIKFEPSLVLELLKVERV